MDSMVIDEASSLAEVEARLASESGCLPAGQLDFIPGHWGTPEARAQQPRSVSRPEEFAGGEALSISCTQTDLPARQQQALVAQWCEVLPSLSGVRRVYFQSKVSQALFDAVVQLPALESLYLKWNGIQALDAVTGHPSLQHLHLGGSGSLVSLLPLHSVKRLETLEVAGLAKAPDLAPLSPLAGLRRLGFCGNDGKPLQVPSLSPLDQLVELEWLHLGALKAVDERLAPLRGLKRLRWLGLPNYYRMEEFASLSKHLPDTMCDWFRPYQRYAHSVFPCPRCKLNCRVMTSGKGSRLLCPGCDTKALARHVWAYLRAA